MAQANDRMAIDSLSLAVLHPRSSSMWGAMSHQSLHRKAHRTRFAAWNSGLASAAPRREKGIPAQREVFERVIRLSAGAPEQIYPAFGELCQQ